jgi:hypothetical protein
MMEAGPVGRAATEVLAGQAALAALAGILESPGAPVQGRQCRAMAGALAAPAGKASPVAPEGIRAYQEGSGRAWRRQAAPNLESGPSGEGRVPTEAPEAPVAHQGSRAAPTTGPRKCIDS